jgi:hypothetical protein
LGLLYAMYYNSYCILWANIHFENKDTHHTKNKAIFPICILVHKKNNVDWVHERTKLTEGLPLVDEVSANFLWIEDAKWSVWPIPTAALSAFYIGATNLRPHYQLSRSGPLIFLPNASSIVLTNLSGPRSRPTTSQEIW